MMVSLRNPLQPDTKGNPASSAAQLKEDNSSAFACSADGRLEVSIAASRLALSSRSVILDLLSIAHARVSHVLAAALLANFKVCIAVELGEIGGGDATLPMQTIDILTHNVLKMVLLEQLNESHVSLGGIRLLNGRSECVLVCRLSRVAVD